MVNNKPVKKTTTKKVVKPKVNTLKSKLSDFLKNGKDCRLIQLFVYLD